MTDEALNALVEALRDVADHAGYVPHLHHTAATAITTLRAQLAEADMETCGQCMGSGYGGHPDSGVSCPVCGGSGGVRNQPHDRTAPEVMHEDAPAAIIGEIGNQIHNLACELHNDEDVSLRLSDLACRTWDAVKLFPTEPTALDRHDAKTREKAMREAVRSLRRRKAVYLLKARKAMRSAEEVQDPDLQSQQWEKSDQMMHTAEAHDYAIADILALIEKPNAC